MIKLLRKLATVMLPAFLCGTLLIGCEADDKYTKVDDLFSSVLRKRTVSFMLRYSFGAADAS